MRRTRHSRIGCNLLKIHAFYIDMFLAVKTYQYCATITDMDRMNMSKTIREQINRTEPGILFGLKDFVSLGNPQVVILELSRLSKKGLIKRLAKGKYYIPKKSKFGELGPSEWQILDKVIKENGGYFAGAMALNRIGVTTQVPSEILIRGARSSRKIKIGNLRIKLVREGIKNIHPSQSRISDILESLRLIKNTPDGSIQLTISRVNSLLGSFSSEEIDQLIGYSKIERPFVRAVLGAILELQNNKKAQSLKTTLNPTSMYKLGIPKTILPNKDNWRII